MDSFKIACTILNARLDKLTYDERPSSMHANPQNQPSSILPRNVHAPLTSPASCKRLPSDMDFSSPSSTPQPHALAIPAPAQGHINPLMRLCKILASHGFLITFVNGDSIDQRISESRQQPQQPPAQTQVPRIRRAQVPIHGLDLANDFRCSSQHLANAIESMGVPLEELIERLSNEGHPVTCLISDVFTSSMSQKLSDKFHIPRIALLSSGQSFNLFCFYLCNGKIDIKDVLNVVLKQDRPADSLFHEDLPGLPSLRVADLPTFNHVVNDTEFMYSLVAHQYAIAYEKSHIIVVNSFDELEGPSLEALRKYLRPPIYSVGPLIEELVDETSTNLWKEEDNCLQWLQDQPPRSVLYVSFGSITVLSKLQVDEVLSGIEASNQRFLWAFRPDLVEDAAYTSVPDDFLFRTKDRGSFVRWAPQLRVLSHPSVGGFLTHCGWNSTMEGIANGVPMLCWPYSADQFMVTKYIVEEWKVGLSFEAGKGGFVSRVDVEKEVRELIEGDKGKILRKNAAALRDASRRSLQEGGSSHKYMKALVEDLSLQSK